MDLRLRPINSDGEGVCFFSFTTLEEFLAENSSQEFPDMLNENLAGMSVEQFREELEKGDVFLPQGQGFLIVEKA